ncbi:MAG: glucose-1-phosphate thymidylyltransferase [Desulfurococcaceae archaeon]
MQGLVLAAGEGTRLRPFTLSRPKHLIPLLGKPMIAYPVEDLASSGIRDIGIVVGYHGDLIREALGDGSAFNAKFTYIVQERRLGIAHAIHRAIEEGFLKEDFVVYLGDNILSSGIRRFVEAFEESGVDAYVLLARVKDPSRFGVAVVRDGKVVRLIEKPREHVSDLALVGVYFFRDPELVARAYRDLKPSWRGEYEVTDLIQWFVDRGHAVGFEVVSGWWKDVGTYEGLLDAIYLLLDRIEPRISGEASGEVVGRVVVEDGARVEGKVYGPAYIGRGALVGRNAIVEHYTSIESGARVLSGLVSRSLVMSEAEVDINRARLTDSVVGSHSRVRCARELHGDLRLVISDFSVVSI